MKRPLAATAAIWSAAAIMILAGCAATDNASEKVVARENLAAACASYAHHLDLMATARAVGQVDDAQWQQVRRVRQTVGPLCEDQELTLAGSADPGDVTGEIRRLVNRYLLTGSL